MATFAQSGSAIVKPSGRAEVSVRGPHRVGTTWRIGYVTLSSTPQGNGVACEARIYRSFEHPAQLLGTSVVADADTMAGLPGDVLSPGDELLAVFTGCLPGTTAYVTMRGDELLWTV